MANKKQKIKTLHNDLMSALALDYLDPSINNGYDHQRFLLNCRNHLKTPREQSIKSVIEVLDMFERKGIMSPENYNILKEVVKGVNQQIVDLIEETEGKILKIKEGPEKDNEKETHKENHVMTHSNDTEGATSKT
jgi:hypothetical protein